MRTLQEKYNGVLEGNFSKAQFVKDANMQFPNLVSRVNSFEDASGILKNRGMIAEAKKMQEPKYSTAKLEDTIAPDVLDTGIKFELDKKYGTLDVTDEQYAKCKEMAIKNLAKDVLYYVKQDSIQLETPGEKMEKVTLKEEVDPKAIVSKMIPIIQDYLANGGDRGAARDIMDDLKNGRNLHVYTDIESVEDLKDQLDYEHSYSDDLSDLGDEENLEEGWKEWVAGGLLALTTLAGIGKVYAPKMDQLDSGDKVELAQNAYADAFKKMSDQEVDNIYREVVKSDIKDDLKQNKFTFTSSTDKETRDAAMPSIQRAELETAVANNINRFVIDSSGAVTFIANPAGFTALEEGHGENPLKFKDSDTFDPTKFYIKDLKSGRILNAVSVQGSKLISYYDTEADAQAQADWITRWEGDPGRFVVLSGDEAEDQVNKQTGVEEYQAPKYSKEEQQLKELFKKIITKVITE